MQRVLIPLDGSTLAERAIPAGVFLAKTLQCPLELLHVIEHPLHEDIPEATIRPSTDAVRRDLRAVVQKYHIDIPVSCNVLVGDPVRRLLESSERNPDAIIAMATHGRSGIVRAVLGSVADKVVRGASGPVLLVRPTPAAHNGLFPVSTIMVGLDGSRLSERALPAAIDLARKSGARLHLVGVVESLWTLAYPTSPYDGAPPDPQVIQELDTRLTNEACEYLSDVASRARESGVYVTWDVTHGNPVEELAREAERVSAGVLVTATHGRGGLSRMFHGSVSTGLTARCDVPLLIVPSARLGSADKVRFESMAIVL